MPTVDTDAICQVLQLVIFLFLFREHLQVKIGCLRALWYFDQPQHHFIWIAAFVDSKLRWMYNFIPLQSSSEGVVRQQAIIWANVALDLCHHRAPLGSTFVSSINFYILKYVWSVESHAFLMGMISAQLYWYLHCMKVIFSIKHTSISDSEQLRDLLTLIN